MVKRTPPLSEKKLKQAFDKARAHNGHLLLHVGYMEDRSAFEKTIVLDASIDNTEILETFCNKNASIKGVYDLSQSFEKASVGLDIVPTLVQRAIKVALLEKEVNAASLLRRIVFHLKSSKAVNKRIHKIKIPLS